MNNTVDLFNLLIANAPVNSVLKINGFYNGFLSDTSFQKLFHFDDLSNRKKNSKYIITLSLELRKILLEIIEAEGEKLIYDIVHFCIADKHEILVASYDTMDFVQIKKSFYCRFSDHVTNQFAGLEVEIIDFIDDHGFFSEIEIASN